MHPNPREPFGIAPLEAMASGLPLVAPDTGGITSYADASNSWPARPDAVSFADQIQSLDHDPARKAPMLERALATAFSYDWSVVCRHFLSLYAEIANPIFPGAAGAAHEPRFFSTLGDYWGREVSSSNLYPR